MGPLCGRFGRTDTDGRGVGVWGVGCVIVDAISWKNEPSEHAVWSECHWHSELLASLRNCLPAKAGHTYAPAPAARHHPWHSDDPFFQPSETRAPTWCQRVPPSHLGSLGWRLASLMSPLCGRFRRTLHGPTRTDTDGSGFRLRASLFTP